MPLVLEDGPVSERLAAPKVKEDEIQRGVSFCVQHPPCITASDMRCSPMDVG